MERGGLFNKTSLYRCMASSKYQSIEKQAECWNVCKLSVKVQSSFKCETPVTNCESAHKLIRAIWDKGKLNEKEQMMAFFISIDKQTVSYHATFMRTVDRTYGNSRYILILALHPAYQFYNRNYFLRDYLYPGRACI